MGGGLSIIFLNNYIRPRCKNFVEVFSSDDLPSDPPTLPCCLIANLSKRNQKGSHFIAMYINKKNQLYYFDSFGLLPPIWNKCLMKFLRPWIEKNSFKSILYPPHSKFSFFVLRMVHDRILFIRGQQFNVPSTIR